MERYRRMALPRGTTHTNQTRRAQALLFAVCMIGLLLFDLWYTDQPLTSATPPTPATTPAPAPATTPSSTGTPAAPPEVTPDWERLERMLTPPKPAQPTEERPAPKKDAEPSRARPAYHPSQLA